ncbi:hypothetical protein ABID65_003325 [Bradyrhizobium sp. S3.9.2]
MSVYWMGIAIALVMLWVGYRSIRRYRIKRLHEKLRRENGWT